MHAVSPGPTTLPYYAALLRCPTTLPYHAAMHSLVHLLTISAVMVHAMLGCCVHQSHANCCTQTDRHLAAGHQTACPNQCCSHESAEDKSTVHDSDSQLPAPHACCHDQCYWPAPEASLDVDLLLQHFATDLGALPSTTAPTSLGFAIAQSQWPDLSPHLLPVRTHLAKRVLIL